MALPVDLPLLESMREENRLRLPLWMTAHQNLLPLMKGRHRISPRYHGAPVGRAEDKDELFSTREFPPITSSWNSQYLASWDVKVLVTFVLEFGVQIRSVTVANILPVLMKLNSTSLMNIAWRQVTASSHPGLIRHLNVRIYVKLGTFFFFFYIMTQLQTFEDLWDRTCCPINI